ncbi:MAG: hypothetical protein ACR2PW_03600 [Gammaproteobacteria bacterium]
MIVYIADKHQRLNFLEIPWDLVVPPTVNVAELLEASEQHLRYIGQLEEAINEHLLYYLTQSEQDDKFAQQWQWPAGVDELFLVGNDSFIGWAQTVRFSALASGKLELLIPIPEQRIRELVYRQLIDQNREAYYFEDARQDAGVRILILPELYLINLAVTGTLSVVNRWIQELPSVARRGSGGYQTRQARVQARLCRPLGQKWAQYPSLRQFGYSPRLYREQLIAKMGEEEGAQYFKYCLTTAARRRFEIENKLALGEELTEVQLTLEGLEQRIGEIQDQAKSEEYMEQLERIKMRLQFITVLS